MSNGPWTREPVPDLMRWEVQAHEWAGQYGGIDTVADLSPASVRRLYDNRSAWFQVERIIVRRVDFIALLKEAAQHDRELTAQTQLNLVEYCWQLQDGEEPEVHRNTRTKYNRILARHGIAPLANFNGRARHIDLEAGCQRLVDTSKVVSLADYARRRSQAV